MTTRLFQDTNVRQSSEVQLRTIKTLLERDFELTDYWLVNTLERRLTSDSRDAVAFPGLLDWNDASSFLPDTGRPAWDVYIVYYGTEGPSGSLIRQLVAPGGAPFSSAYGALTLNLRDSNPENNADVIYTRILTQELKAFEVTPQLANGTVDVRLRLHAQGTRRASGEARTEENLDVNMSFQLKNTWPRV